MSFRSEDLRHRLGLATIAKSHDTSKSSDDAGGVKI